MATLSLPGLEAFIAELGLEPIPSFTSANILSNPLDIYHSYLAGHFHALVECDADLVYNSIQLPNTTGNGDLDIVLPRLKLLGANPKDLPGELLKKYQPHPLFSVPFKDGVHIRFFFSSKMIPRLLLPYISDRKTAYGMDISASLRHGPGSERKKVLVEFSSPNLATDFTAAHLRSTIFGAFVANIYETMGWEVFRVNYLGDWGQHLGLLSVGWKKYGSEEDLGKQTNRFKYIHELYAKMEEELQPEQELRKQAREDGQDTTILETQGLFAERAAAFKQMEDGEPDAIALWKTIRDISIEYYVQTYARLNISFDEYSGESQVSLAPESITEVESILKDKGICEEKDGAWVIDFDKHGARLGPATIRGRNGSTTYLLRDIATVFDRHKTHSFDKMLYIVCEQDVHFRQVFKAVRIMGYADIADKLQHITFPRASGPLAELGAQLLGDILDQCEAFMREILIASPDEYKIEDTDVGAKTMGINSIVVQELSARKAQSTGLAFNLMTSVEGETSSNLQLCYTRLCSAIASIGALPSPEETIHLDYSSLWEAPWCDLLRLMARYPDVTSSTFKTSEPGTILSYLFHVIEELTACLDEADEDEAGGEGAAAGSKYAARAVLYENVRQILENAMKLLGITPISK